MAGFDEAFAALARRLEAAEAGETAEGPLAPLVAAAVEALEGGEGRLDLDRAVAVLQAGARLLERRARALLPPEPEPAAGPPVPETGGEPDPADELARHLSAYRGFKEAAALLRRFEEEQSRRFPSGGADPAARPGTGLEGITLDQLIAAFQRVWEQAAEDAPREIPREEVTVQARMEALLARLEGAGELPFTALFEGQATRRQVVVTFLALLELVRLGRLRVRQEVPFGEIHVALRPAGA